MYIQLQSTFSTYIYYMMIELHLYSRYVNKYCTSTITTSFDAKYRNLSTRGINFKKNSKFIAWKLHPITNI